MARHAGVGAVDGGVHPAVMQKLAGHSSARTTMDIYTHVNADAKRAAMEVVQIGTEKSAPIRRGTTNGTVLDFS